MKQNDTTSIASDEASAVIRRVFGTNGEAKFRRELDELLDVLGDLILTRVFGPGDQKVAENLGEIAAISQRLETLIAPESSLEYLEMMHAEQLDRAAIEAPANSHPEKPAGLKVSLVRETYRDLSTRISTDLKTLTKYARLAAKLVESRKKTGRRRRPRELLLLAELIKGGMGAADARPTMTAGGDFVILLEYAIEQLNARYPDGPRLVANAEELAKATLSGKRRAK